MDAMTTQQLLQSLLKKMDDLTNGQHDLKIQVKEGQEVLKVDVDGLKQGQARLEQGQVRLERDVKGLKQGQARLEQGQTRLEQDIKEMKQEIAGLKLEVQGLKQDVHGLQQGQARMERDLREVRREIELLKKEQNLFREDLTGWIKSLFELGNESKHYVDELDFKTARRANQVERDQVYLEQNIKDDIERSVAGALDRRFDKAFSRDELRRVINTRVDTIALDFLGRTVKVDTIHAEIKATNDKVDAVRADVRSIRPCECGSVGKSDDDSASSLYGKYIQNVDKSARLSFVSSTFGP